MTVRDTEFRKFMTINRHRKSASTHAKKKIAAILLRISQNESDSKNH